MKRLVLLISATGKGTNLQAILRAVEKKQIKATVVCVISETETSPGLLIAKETNVPTALSPRKSDLFALLKKYEPDYIVLCGWKQFIPDEVLKAYERKILNLHPGVVPETIGIPFNNPDGTEGVWNKGLYADLAIENFLKTKSSYAGSSVHFLTQEFDFGEVLGRTFEKIKPNDTIQSLYARLKAKEHELYIKVLAEICK